MIIPSFTRLQRGYKAYRRHEKRNPMYKVATYLVKQFWGNSAKMADGLGVLLMTWHQAFYRYGSFDFNHLENCIRKNLKILNSFRYRDILSYSTNDNYVIRILFNQFLNALKIAGKKRAKKSPVAVAKALHLLAPAFFPLWDSAIAKAYGYQYSQKPIEKYIAFIKETKDLAVKYGPQIKKEVKDSTVIKVIDEYNYTKYTKKWV